MSSNFVSEFNGLLTQNFLEWNGTNTYIQVTSPASSAGFIVQSGTLNTSTDLGPYLIMQEYFNNTTWIFKQGFVSGIVSTFPYQLLPNQSTVMQRVTPISNLQFKVYKSAPLGGALLLVTDYSYWCLEIAFFNQLNCNINSNIYSTNGTVLASSNVPINLQQVVGTNISSSNCLPINVVQILSSTVSASNPLPINISQINSAGYGGGSVPIIVNSVNSTANWVNLKFINDVAISTTNPLPIDIEQVIGTVVSSTNGIPVNQQNFPSH